LISATQEDALDPPCLARRSGDRRRGPPNRTDFDPAKECAQIPAGAIISVHGTLGKDGRLVGDVRSEVNEPANPALEAARERAAASVQANLSQGNLPPSPAERPVTVRFDMDRLCGRTR
jgi:hypothetical protein